MSDVTFPEFIRRIRQGDAQAADELVRKYEPVIRREVRQHMEDERMRRLFDSVDISQSVLASFFLRAVAGAYELDDHGQLKGLLLQMARNKLASKSRWQFSEKRERQRKEITATEWERTPNVDPSPSQALSAQEIIEKGLELLSDDERQIVDFRRQGCSWSDIASQLQSSPDACRMKLTRAMDRVSEILGLDVN